MIKMPITMPKGMSHKEFDKWLDNLQHKVSNLSADESTTTEQLLEYAELAKLNNGGSFNWNVKQQLNKSSLSVNALFCVNEFMRYGYLPLLHSIIQERKLRQVITNDVNNSESVFLAKGWTIKGDFWQKKIWKNSEHYELTIVSRGIEINTMKYVKCSALFDKFDNKISPDTVVFAANILELI